MARKRWAGRESVRSVFVVLALASLAPARLAHAQAVASAPTANAAIDPALALSTFDSAWSRINATHYDSTFNGVDWLAVRRELRPRAQAADTYAELRGVIREMLARLGESHYTLIPGEVADAVDPERARQEGDGAPGDVGLSLRLADGQLVVWAVDSAGPAAAAGVRPGWVVESIGAWSPAPVIERLDELEEGPARRNGQTQLVWGANGQLEGPSGSSLEMTFMDGAGRRIDRALERRRRPGEPVRFGNLPTFMADLSHDRIASGTGCVGLIRFNIWMVPVVPRFDRAIDALRDCDGMILDLRGNPGGIAGMVMGVAGHFLNERVVLGTMRSRSTELNFVANPRRVTAAGQPVEPFDGPLAILVDGLSVSTSEFFAGGMQAVGRARVFGETTAGQALPATLLRLPSGDVLMHVVADFTAAGGVRIEGRGVVPDQIVPLDRNELLAGHDAAFDAALRWLQTQIRSTSRAERVGPAATVRWIRAPLHARSPA